MRFISSSPLSYMSFIRDIRPSEGSALSPSSFGFWASCVFFSNAVTQGQSAGSAFDALMMIMSVFDFQVLSEGLIGFKRLEMVRT